MNRRRKKEHIHTHTHTHHYLIHSCFFPSFTRRLNTHSHFSTRLYQKKRPHLHRVSDKCLVCLICCLLSLSGNKYEFCFFLSLQDTKVWFCVCPRSHYIILLLDSYSERISKKVEIETRMRKMKETKFMKNDE